MTYKILLVALGGALGAVCRYGLARGLQHMNPHPWFSLGVLTANLVGCILMGALVVWVGGLNEAYREAIAAFVLIGFLGSLTTFSTFILEIVKLAQNNALRVILTQVSAHLLLGILGLWIGHSLAERLSGR